MKTFLMRIFGFVFAGYLIVSLIGCYIDDEADNESKKQTEISQTLIDQAEELEAPDKGCDCSAQYNEVQYWLGMVQQCIDDPGCSQEQREIYQLRARIAYDSYSFCIGMCTP